ncbi:MULTISPECIES: hypothetical protein [Bacteroidales]|jgi:hypothetical protein|uniref:hypothetical protein n=1 Tax=Bacteroidales TaxID=171549 RepID=UPI000E8EA3D7|nr:MULTISPECIES: hypothetical protein [Bacteroidales]MBJ2197687.1 hypothetical protein [Muribaculaceae bacterium]MCI9029174.1 hypothetical protein [Muribaculaceae bacterium]HBY15938.1 hypothetical protein [Porphyromonadaceae bacterium]
MMMRSILKMKSVAWGALVLVVVWLGFIIGTPAPWWTYTSVFFVFMMVFCHLAALYIYKVSPRASRKLDVIAMIMGILFMVALIVMTIASA